MEMGIDDLDQAFLNLSDSEFDSDDSEIITLTPIRKKTKCIASRNPPIPINSKLPISRTSKIASVRILSPIQEKANYFHQRHPRPHPQVKNGFTNTGTYSKSFKDTFTSEILCTPVKKKPKCIGIPRPVVKIGLPIHSSLSKSSKLIVSKVIKSRNKQMKPQNTKKVGPKAKNTKKGEKPAISSAQNTRELVTNWLRITFEETNDKKDEILKADVQQMHSEKFKENAVSINLLGRILHATFPLLSTKQSYRNRKRHYAYTNLRIKL